MSENIIAFGGDTTTRDLWSGGPVGSTGMSRLLSPKSRSFSMVAWQQAKPILDSELNLMQQIQNQIHADYLRTMLTSGIISLDLATNVTDKLNALRISNAVAHVNGCVVVKHFCNSTTYIFKNDIELHKEFDNHYMNVAYHGCTNHRQILQWNL